MCCGVVVEYDDLAFDGWALHGFANRGAAVEAVLSKIDRAALSLNTLEVASWRDFMLPKGLEGSKKQYAASIAGRSWETQENFRVSVCAVCFFLASFPLVLSV